MADLINSDEKPSLERAAILKNGLTFDESRYTYDDKFVPSTGSGDVHTMTELANLARENKDIVIEGTCLGLTRDSHSRQPVIKRRALNREYFLKAFEENEKQPERTDKRALREAFCDPFATDQPTTSGLVGDDFVPFLGGPFYKQLYIYDYLRMHGYAFWAVNHWPMARAAVNIMRDFTLGRGYRVDIQDKDGNRHPRAEAMWEAFEEANDIKTMMSYLAEELSVYGETMLWWLPNNDSRIAYQLGPKDKVPKGIIPRVRLMDPSMFWEIVTYPEDISRVLYYQWVSPTQYQMYTNGNVPVTKFITQQIPGDQMDHYKINCMSNEKRGRSDLFSALGFMKRLTDSVNYSIIGLQKSAAWSIDTMIDGNQTDINNYIAAQRAMGTIPPAGSEFVHSSKVKREYLGNQGASRGAQSQAFDWCFSMAAMALGIPVSYFGTHLSGGQTRASALVATEPVAKRFEIRQSIYEKILTKMVKRVFSHYGITDAFVEVTMPELMVQDRSTKLKDLALAETQKWLSKERAAEIASKEFQISNYDYDQEKVIIDQQEPADVQTEQQPLSGNEPDEDEEDADPTGISSQFRKQVSDASGY